MKIKKIALLAALLGTAAIPTNATTLAEQGGAGTIDSSSVALHEIVRYTLGNDDENHFPVAFATDNARRTNPR